jgi:hypothetical protein
MEGNPPFQNTKKDGNKTGQSLWSIFTKIAFERTNDIVALVLPSRWCGHSYNIMKGKVRLYESYIRNGLIAANIGECSKYFDEGLGEEYFSYFISQKEKANESIITTLKSTFVVDNKDVDFIPCRPFDIADIGIIKKIHLLASNRGSWDKFRIIPGKHPRQGKRFLIGYGRYCDYEKMGKIVDNGTTCGSTNSLSQYYALETSSQEEGENIRSIFESNLFTYYAKMFFTVDRIYVGTLKALPFLEPNKIWTNEEIYDVVGLTSEEIIHIDNFLKNSGKVNQKRINTLDNKKSKKRVDVTGEVFTPPELIRVMFDQYPTRCWELKKTFCDPACGNGNFLVETLKRKVELGHNKTQALKTIYGIDLMQDNVNETRTKLLEIAGTSTTHDEIVQRQIVQHNALTFDWSQWEENPMMIF